MDIESRVNYYTNQIKKKIWIINNKVKCIVRLFLN